MDKYGKLIDSNTLRFERMLPGPIERVWEYLVDPEKRGKWFCSGTIKTQVGVEVDFIFDHATLSPEDDPVPEKFKQYEGGSTSKAKVLKVKEPRLLVLDWEGGIVTFELEQKGTEVQLTLTHERLKEEKSYRTGVLGGWHTHLDILVDQLNGRTPKGFWKVYMPLEGEYDSILAENIK